MKQAILKRSTPIEPTVALVRLQFYGDALDVMRDGDTLWVSARRVCEALGIDPDTQRKKLKEKPWAVTALKAATGPDGKKYETFCISHRSLPLWLATIEPSRTNPAIQEKLVRYQRECAEVLARMFFGEERPAVSPEQFAIVLDEIRAVRAEGQALRAANDALAATVIDLRTKLLSQTGAITGVQVDIIRMEVKQLAYMRVALKKNKNTKSARMSVENLINAAAQWGGRGQRRCNMPADRWPHVQTCIATHRSDLEADLKRNGDVEEQILAAVRGEQQVLFKKSDAN